MFMKREEKMRIVFILFHFNRLFTSIYFLQTELIQEVRLVKMDSSNYF
jgi:hypothetical protein